MKDIFQELLSSGTINAEAGEYLRVHLPRYRYLLSVVSSLRKNFGGKSSRILDIGPSVFTQALEKTFPNDSVFSMGLVHKESRGGHLPAQTQVDNQRFYSFNLNDSQFKEKWIEVTPCDIIIMAEVLEHLYTAPTLVLNFLNTCLKPGGYLVIQTPNAAALKNRILMMLGRNPFQMIRENSDNPGHFREYTLKELKAIAHKTGFSAELFEYKNYFSPANTLERVYTAITNIFSGSFKSGITIVLKKQ